MQTFKLALIFSIFFLLVHWTKNRPAFNRTIVYLYSCLIRCHDYKFYLSYLSNMSSRYMTHFKLQSTQTQNCFQQPSKVARAMHKPNGIRINSNKPRLVVNAVFCYSWSQQQTANILNTSLA